MHVTEAIKQHYEEASTVDAWSQKGAVSDALDTYGEWSQNRAIFGGAALKGTVLDLGSGTGHYARQARKRGAAKVVCTDLSHGMLACSQRLAEATDNLFFVQADAAALPFKAETFDAVINVGLFEHLSETRQVISELHRVLKTDGLLITRFHNRYSIPGILLNMRSRLQRRPPFGYPFYRMYSRKEAVDLHRNAFGVKSVEHMLLLPLPIVPGFVIRFLHKRGNQRWMRWLFSFVRAVEKGLIAVHLGGLFSYCFVIVFSKKQEL
ncbi:MAG: class I SAM-dependent methyltransferase [Phycisphaerae bacterium]|nr:class I SAM-dependent methyltransferase [Phycisphaerae bacterium]